MKKFTRLWYEVNINEVIINAVDSTDVIRFGKKWVPYNKGGAYRKWYGNDEYLVNWKNDGYEIKHFFDDKGKLRSRPQGSDHYFKVVITWSKITSDKISFRLKHAGQISSDAGMTIRVTEEDLLYMLAFCNSCIAEEILKIYSPTLNCELGDVGNLPIRILDNDINTINELTNNCLRVSKKDWMLYETAWDFKRSPLV